MKQWFLEFITVYTYSGRTQFFFIFGILALWLIPTLGDYVLSDIQFRGIFKGLEDVLIENATRRYDKVAYGSLIACWVAAIGTYKKDKKRLERFY